jgi:uncharacterized protein (DUF58 family)
MSLRPQRSKSRRTLSWLGIAAIVGGLVLIWLFFEIPFLTNNPNVIYPLMYLGTGGAMIAWGVRSLSEELLAVFRRLRKRASSQYRVRMPREAAIYGLILVVLCAGALMGNSNMLMLVFGLMAGPFVLNGQITLGILKKLSVARGLPEHAWVGDRFRVKLSLHNRKWFFTSWMVSIEDPIVGPRDQLVPVALFASVPPRSSREAFYEVGAARRGVYEFGPMRVVSRFPLGLMERSVELGTIERLTVFPRIGRILPRWHESVEAGDPITDSTWAAAGINSDEFHGLREYRGGDNPRTIHWRTTARRNQLMVREFQHSRRHDLLLAVELWLPADPRPADFERVELAISFAASICVDHLQRTNDAAIDLILGGSEIFQETGWTGAAALGGILRQLALADAGAAKGLAAAACRAAEFSNSSKRKLLITTRRLEEGSARLPASDPGHDLASAGFEAFEAAPESLVEYVEYVEYGAPPAGAVR